MYLYKHIRNIYASVNLNECVCVIFWNVTFKKCLLIQLFLFSLQVIMAIFQEKGQRQEKNICRFHIDKTVKTK